MAEMQGVSINKLQGGLGRTNASTDNHIGYIINIPSAATAIATAIHNAGKGVAVTSLYQVEQLGINASFDANHNVNVHAQISEIFRLSPDATLYLFDKVVEADLKGFISTNKEIKGYALHVTFTGENAPTLTTVLSAQQNIVDHFAQQNRFLDFVLVGADGLATYTTDLYTLTSPNVGVVVACEKADGITALGSALGMLAVRAVNENLGSVSIKNYPISKRGNVSYPLTDANANKWTTAYLSNGTEITVVDNTVLKGIIDKGYIAVASYEGFAGMYFTDSTTAIERASDFGNIENNRVFNKAARAIRQALLPFVKGVVKKDPATGFIASTTAKFWESKATQALKVMEANDEISGSDVYINHKQVVNSTNPVYITAMVVMDGIVHQFDVSLGLTNSIN